MSEIYHVLGISIISSSLIFMFITFYDIWTKGKAIYSEPNIYLLTIETSLCIFGLAYLIYLYSKLPELIRKRVEGRKLSFWQKLQLKVNGYTFLRWEKREGWTDYLPIYLVKCKKHGLFEDYPHGYSGYFICPKCFEEKC